MLTESKINENHRRRDPKLAACVLVKWSKNIPVCGIVVVKRKITANLAVIFLKMVDPKGIEPSNLTDANRALSQLSYGPILPLFARFSEQKAEF